MSLGQAISTSLGGLRTAQAGLSLVSTNVANAGTAGYVRRTLTQVQTLGAEFSSGVRVEAVNRELDAFVQRQLRTELAGGSYAAVRSQLMGRLNALYGKPGSAGSLDYAFNALASSLQALATTPDSYSARGGALAAAQALTANLNTLTGDVQALRSESEQGIADGVARANLLLKDISQLNVRLQGARRSDASEATLLDQRDAALDRLTELMDVKVVETPGNQVMVFTGSGVQLVNGATAAALSFDSHVPLDAGKAWSDAAERRGVGTIRVTSADGATVDLMGAGGIRSGEIAALLEMRDRVLPEAQAQLDSVAEALARMLSDRTVAGAPASSAGAAGFDLDLSGLSSGNSIDIAFADVAGATRHLKIVRVDDPAALPLDHHPGASVELIGIDFSAGIGAAVNQLNAALGTRGLRFSNPSGSVLRILDDGPANAINVTSASVTVTASNWSSGAVQLPFFLDGQEFFTGAVRESGSQSAGFAGRILVNPELMADPSRLVRYAATTASGDSTRPGFLFAQLTSAAVSFNPASGIGTPAAPFHGNIAAFIQTALAQQAQATNSAKDLAQGQQVVVESLRSRLQESTLR